MQRKYQDKFYEIYVHIFSRVLNAATGDPLPSRFIPNSLELMRVVVGHMAKIHIQ